MNKKSLRINLLLTLVILLTITSCGDNSNDGHTAPIPPYRPPETNIIKLEASTTFEEVEKYFNAYEDLFRNIELGMYRKQIILKTTIDLTYDNEETSCLVSLIYEDTIIDVRDNDYTIKQDVSCDALDSKKLCNDFCEGGIFISTESDQNANTFISSLLEQADPNFKYFRGKMNNREIFIVKGVMKDSINTRSSTPNDQQFTIGFDFTLSHFYYPLYLKNDNIELVTVDMKVINLEDTQN